MREHPVALDIAITVLKRGEPLPLDLAARLMGMGYDVEALEARYRA